MENLIDTIELAKVLRVRAPTARRAFSMNGHYQGLVPVKMPNGRLLWSLEEVNKLIESRKPRAA